MTDIFYWIGVVTVALLGFAATAVALIAAYVFLIHDRFNVIFFRKGQRRLSIASWHSSKLVDQDTFEVDDFLINERPLYVSYRFGRRRAFVMFGLLSDPRYRALWGKHPEEQL